MKKIIALLLAMCFLLGTAQAADLHNLNQPYEIDGIDAYESPRSAAKKFQVDQIIYLVADDTSTQIPNASGDDAVITVTNMNDLVAEIERNPFSTIFVDPSAIEILEKDALIDLSETIHLVLVFGYDDEADILNNFLCPETADLSEYAYACCVISPDGTFQIYDFFESSAICNVNDALRCANKAKDAAYTIYNLYVCDDTYTEVTAAELEATTQEPNIATGSRASNNRVELFHSLLAGTTQGYVYTSSSGGSVLKTVKNGEAIIYTGTTATVSGSTWYQVRVWTSKDSLSYGWIPPMGSYMDYPMTFTLYDYGYNYADEDADIVVYDADYGAGYKMASSSSLYNGSGTATTSITSLTRIWFTEDAGTAGATKPYLVTISGYSTYSNNRWTYHSLSATTFVDAGFNTGKVSSYKMNTLP